MATCRIAAADPTIDATALSPPVNASPVSAAQRSADRDLDELEPAELAAQPIAGCSGTADELRAAGRRELSEIGAGLQRQAVAAADAPLTVAPKKRANLSRISRKLLVAAEALSAQMPKGSAVAVTIGAKVGVCKYFEIGPSVVARIGREDSGEPCVNVGTGIGSSTPFPSAGYHVGIHDTGAAEGPEIQKGWKLGLSWFGFYVTNRDPVLGIRTAGFVVPLLGSAGIADDGTLGFVAPIRTPSPFLRGTFGVFVRHPAMKSMMKRVFAGLDVARAELKAAGRHVQVTAREGSELVRHGWHGKQPMSVPTT